MNDKKISTPLLVLIATFLFSGFTTFASQKGKNHDQKEEEGLIELAENSEDIYKVKVAKLQMHDIAKEITSPAEVVLNAYHTGIVALRIDGQIVKRLVKMGDYVVKGQPMAIISSIPMSEAQQAYIVDVNEWRRVEQLGQQVVSGKRFIAAQSQWRSSKARLLAYGLDQQQLSHLEKEQMPDGIYHVTAQIKGMVMKDNFIEGQYANAGTQLFVVSDESTIWVEASVSPDQAALFAVDDIAEIEHSGERHLGKIIQISHFVSESTRTQKIRIEIDNSKDDLHPGQFVSARLQQAKSEQKIALPEAALVRTADGDWGVFVEVKPRHFKQQEVELLGRQGELMIISGLALGTPVVVEGAFYLSAELAKAGFDPHNH